MFRHIFFGCFVRECLNFCTLQQVSSICLFYLCFLLITNLHGFISLIFLLRCFIKLNKSSNIFLLPSFSIAQFSFHSFPSFVFEDFHFLPYISYENNILISYSQLELNFHNLTWFVYFFLSSNSFVFRFFFVLFLSLSLSFSLSILNLTFNSFSYFGCHNFLFHSK